MNPMPSPSPERVRACFAAWREHGDQSAREELVRAYLPMASRLARRYRGAWEPAEDLRQVAYLGLLKAIDRYDVSRETSFQTYAVPTILGEIKRYFRDCGWAVHVPRGTQDLALKLEQVQRTLLTRTGRQPTFGELAEYLEVSIEDVCDAAEAAGAHHATSLDAPMENDEGDRLALVDTLGGLDDSYERVEDRMCVARAWRCLNERERRVLGMRFLDERTQVQIAAELGVSQMQVSRILRAALERVSATADADGH
jgi:RNA polymerase sigma-B factor